MFNGMIRRGISTNDIRHFVVKQAAQCRIYKSTNPKLEKVAMRIKRMDALALAKRLRQAKHRCKMSLISAHSDLDKANRVIDRINRLASQTRRNREQELPC